MIEGCAVIVLRRLSDALAHGDHILALVRGSAIRRRDCWSVSSSAGSR